MFQLLGTWRFLNLEKKVFNVWFGICSFSLLKSRRQCREKKRGLLMCCFRNDLMNNIPQRERDKISTYRCRRLGSWKILAGMVDRRLRLSRRTCRLLDRLAKQPLSSAVMRLLLRNLRRRGRSESFERGCRCKGVVEGWREYRMSTRTLTGSWGAELGRSWPWSPPGCCCWGQASPGRRRARAAPPRPCWSCCLLWKHRQPLLQ